ncbi:sensor histidine kinase [Stenotrophomonas tumulicola]|uniref:histidine kinase n=1 Tax=Stenotrophomonas tumulicola TaxID=1685415 RepID=A0A7W3FKC6_9GAMM|nr:HAMP domain-containing sensor histidine kinase [Stenotrophomonas tumulicola]MBA8681159.1 HAMP domain-containing histidine kinase [Stenotrophomonas tumulicola]
MRLRPLSLAARLVLASLLGMAAAIGVAFMVMSDGKWISSPGRVMRIELADEVADIAKVMRPAADGALSVVLPERMVSMYDAMPRDAAYMVLDTAGTVRAQSVPGPAREVLQAMSSGNGFATAYLHHPELMLGTLERDVVQDGQTYTIRVAQSRRLILTLKRFAGELYLRSAAINSFLALLTFAVVVYLTVRRMLRSVREASAEAARIGPGTLSARLPTDRVPTELAPMVSAFNGALARLETGFRVQQEFLASAAHELKTPLALLQAQIELEDSPNKADLLRDTALMARIVHQLLHLAEASEGHNYGFAQAELAPVLLEALEYLQRAAQRRGVRLEHAIQAPPRRLQMDAGAVFVLAKNLIENAINHAPPGSVVLLSCDDSGFRVCDQGSGVAAGDQPHLFKRFWRGNCDGDGAGLGLAICQQICHMHGWTIRHEPPAAGNGACFVVELGPPGKALAAHGPDPDPGRG